MLPASCGFPIPRGCCAAPFHRSSRVYTPPGCQQPCGAGPLDPHPPGDCFVRLALVAAFPSEPLPPAPRPVTHLGLSPASCVFPVSLGPSCDPSHTPLSAPSPYPSIPCFYPTGPPATLWRGPTGSASCLGPARATSTVRSLPVPFRLGGVLSSGPVVVPSSWPPRPPLPVLFPNLVTCCCCFCTFSSRATRGLSSARLLHPGPPPPARSALLALLCRCGVLFGFFLPPPSPPCLLPCGSLLPACTHNNSAQAICHCSPRCSCPVPSPSWSVALGGFRPCQVGAPPSRLTNFSALHPPLSSVSCPPSYCCSPAPCAHRLSSLRHGCISRAFTRLRASALSSDL